MKERFLNIEKVVGEKIDEFFREVLDMPRPYAEVVVNFKHEKKCSRQLSLKTIEKEEFLNLRDGGVWGINTHPLKVIRKYLECPECHFGARFSAKLDRPISIWYYSQS